MFSTYNFLGSGIWLGIKWLIRDKKIKKSVDSINESLLLENARNFLLQWIRNFLLDLVLMIWLGQKNVRKNMENARYAKML